MRRKIILCILHLILIGSLIPLVLFALKNLERNRIDDKVEKAVETIEVDDRSSIQKAFEEIWAINSDVIAFLYFPNTDMSFPVLQTSDNDLYLDKNLYKKYDEQGSIFMDYRANSDFSSFNTFVYGHSVFGGNGKFSFLKKYMDESYFLKNPSFQVITPNAVYQAEIFSAYLEKAFSTSNQPDIKNRDSLNIYIDEVKAKSFYPTNAEFSENNNMITLYTCADTNGSLSSFLNGSDRYFVHAILKKIES